MHHYLEPSTSSNFDYNFFYEEHLVDLIPLFQKEDPPLDPPHQYLYGPNGAGGGIFTTTFLRKATN